MSSPLATAFVQGQGSKGSKAPPDDPALELALQAAHTTAAAAHAFKVSPERFARFLGTKCPGAKDAVLALEGLQAPDLYLTCACLDGDRAALEVLDRTLAKAARAARTVAANLVDEIHQRLRERVLVATDGELPKLNDYAGTGPLEGWCKVAAVRIALRLKEGAAERDVTLEPNVLEDGGPVLTGVESIAARHQHAAILGQAFEEATRSLTHEERVLLRYHFLDGLNFEEMAPLFKTHRSTISRRVAAARKKLLDATKQSLKERGASTTEVSSLIRVAKSQLEVDLTAWLRTQV